MAGQVNIHDYDQIVIPTNKFQTPITRQLLDKLPNEVVEQFLECVNDIDFVRRLISPDRLYAKDLERDSNGRAIIDITNPPIVENTDYFREAIIHYQKYGCYTPLKPNSNPNSEFGKFMKRELYRCWNGMLRKEDGVWISGYMYWYMNYSPMMINVQEDDSKNFSSRVEAFPRWWEGVWLRFNYIDQARFGGMYNDFKGGEHCCELASRGKSKSYGLAAISSHNLLVGESELSHKRNICILAGKSKEYLQNEKDGTLNKIIPILDHCATQTQFPRLKIVDSPNKMAWQMGYRDKITNAIMGSRNTLAAVAVKDDSDKLRGKRGTIMVEEFGSMPKMLELFGSVRDSVEEGGQAFAQIYLVGTSGNDDDDFSGAIELVTKPKGYKIYALPNVYSKKATPGQLISFFYPIYMNYGKFQNKDGISDVTGALLDILLDRYNIKYNSSEADTLTKRIAERCITPEEALIKVHSSIFPINDINDRKKDLMLNKSELDKMLYGHFGVKSDGSVYFESGVDVPINTYPFKGKDTTGATTIKEMPIKDNNGNVYCNRYIAGLDPYDSDKTSDSVSLGSWYILDTWTDELVAWYCGRPNTADEFYEQSRRAMIFYNAVLCYENNKLGLFTYYRKMNSLKYLSGNLESLKSKFHLKETYGNMQYGVNAITEVNKYARELIKYWLMKERVILDKDGNEIMANNVKFIYDQGLLDELSLWDGYRNCDRVSALGMVMLLYSERTAIFGDDFGKNNDTPSILDDNYFKDNYDEYSSDNELEKFLASMK